MLTVAVIAFGMAFILPGLTASASTGEDGEFFKEHIKGIEFTIPYDKSEVYVEKSIEGLVGKINVYDEETNELLDTFSVEDQAKPKYGMLAYDNTVLKNVSRSRYDNGLETMLRARIEVYSYGSFRQINRVLGTQWFTGSGSHTIENATADSIPNGGDYPTTSIDVLGDATIQIATTQEFSAGWEAAGFSIGGSVSGTHYYRKYIELGFTYSLY
ncbi:hypothetical protein [Terrihalobacillus insolitus]|uniref:hypothetical protein n=1 Tax=Terrihalobacillus insolitus TaxID=2950438 RepID=UPI002342380D|nr:hypothetical protein [Terrihalobacillus insolitus]MDC3414504.1 hypothetical protein [Terrihalobacillus insolitus]